MTTKFHSRWDWSHRLWGGKEQ